MKNNCLTQEVIYRLILDQLDDKKRAQVIKHLGECDLCSDAVEGLRMLVSEKGPGSAVTSINNLHKEILDKVKFTKDLNDGDHQSLFHNWLFWIVFTLVFMSGIFFALLSLNKKKVELTKPAVRKIEISNTAGNTSVKRKSEPPTAVKKTMSMPSVKKINVQPLKTPVKDSVVAGANQQKAEPVKQGERPSENIISENKRSNSSQEPKEIFTVVEEQPGFPGGDEARIKFLQSNLKYPEEAKELGIQGKVYITFVVETDGSLNDIKVLRGIGGGCDEEAIRLVKNMPKWIPGKQRGVPVRVQFNLPINFRLQ
jgi:TonB family protein